MHFSAAQRGDDLKEVFVEEAPEASRAEGRIDTHEVDVRDTRLGLRDKADKECLNDARSADGKAGRVEVLKEQTRQQGTNWSTTPPLINDVGHELKVFGRKRADGMCRHSSGT